MLGPNGSKRQPLEMFNTKLLVKGATNEGKITQLDMPVQKRAGHTRNSLQIQCGYTICISSGRLIHLLDFTAVCILKNM